MTVYSHSRLSTYEQCKYKYKLRYLDKIPPPIKKSIEAHLGICVHDSLEWLYKKVLNGRIPELDELIKKYSEFWQEKDSDDILIVKNISKQEYFNKGVKFLLDYYLKNKPFQDGTLELEKRVWITLEENFPHKMIGYIDRLTYNKNTDEYEIHDYKTANFLPDKKKFMEDRQLALYSMAIKKLYNHEKPVRLVWHYLNYNLEITSRRTNEQLEKLRKELIRLINEVENTKEFPYKKSVLCEWCEYKPYCKAWENQLPLKYQKNLEPKSNEVKINENQLKIN